MAAAGYKRVSLSLFILDRMSPMSDLSYPIGKFAPPSDTPSKAVRRPFARSRSCGARPSSRESVDRFPAPHALSRGGWTVAQVVHHLADAHINGYVRFKWALTEERPAIKLYDQVQWATLPDATTADIDDSLRLLEVVHARWGQSFDAMTTADFSRELIHPVRGPETLDRHVALYAWHGLHHTAHVTNLRTRMGW